MDAAALVNYAACGCTPSARAFVWTAPTGEFPPGARARQELTRLRTLVGNESDRNQ